jgi:uncharacterized protein (TIGR03118 family)
MTLLRPFRAVFVGMMALPIVAFGGSFTQSNLSSDIPGLAAFTDANLKNPWGISFSGTSPIWVSDQGTGVSTLYNGTGSAAALVVSIPPTGATPPQGPTGQVFNTTASSFNLPVGGKSLFLFATLAGTIDGWNGGSGTTAQQTVFSDPGAVLTGLALGNNGTNDFLYAANFAGGKIDIIDSTFSKTTLAGNFTDPNLPAGYSPYNIQNINGLLYVEYALVDPTTHKASESLHQGVVDVFDTNGNFMKRLVLDGALSSPWGVTLAPAGFGEFGGDLLVGNFGDGAINAFNPTTGAFIGTVSDRNNNPLLNDGLWGIGFRPAAAGFDPNALYFVAGINDEADGLFGRIQAVPEPGTFLLVSILGAALIFARKFGRA